MSLYLLLFVSASAFAALEWWLIPRARRHARKETSHKNLGRIARLATLEFLRTLAAVAVFTYAAASLVLASFVLWGNVSAAKATELLKDAKELKEGLQHFGGPWDIATLVALICILLVLISRRSKKVMNQRYVAELNRLLEARNGPDWRELPATAEMQEVEEVYARLTQQMEQASQQPDEGSQKKAEQLGEALSQLAARYVLLDCARRVEDLGIPEEEPPHTFAERARVFFISRGLLSFFEGTSRAMLLAGLALLCLSFLTVSAGTSIRSGVEATISHLDDVKVRASQKEAEERYQQASQKGEQSTQPLDQATVRAIGQLSRSYENAVGGSLLWNLPSEAVADSAEIKRAAVREKILQAGVVSDSSAKTVEEVPSLNSQLLAVQDREALQSYARALDQEGPTTAIGKSFEKKATALAERSESFRNMLHSFQEPATVGEVKQKLVSQVLSMAMDNTIDPGSSMGELAKELSKEVGPDSISKFFVSQEDDFLARAQTEGVQKAMAHLSESPSSPFLAGRRQAAIVNAVNRLPEASQLSHDVHMVPPVLREQAAAGNDVNKAIPMLNHLKEVEGVTGAEDVQLTRALRTYSDYFPGQVGENLTTPAAEVARSWHPDYPAALREVPTSAMESVARGAAEGIAENVAVSFERAASFEMLTGFVEVGGVLIGRTETTSPIQFRDLRWKVDGERTTVMLVRDDGKEFPFAFRTSTLHQALMYAADGRPLTVTMTSSDPLPDLKIHVHPALVDTPLGCRAIEMDSFVDEFTSRSPQRSRASRQVYLQHALYQYATLRRQMDLLQAIDKEQKYIGRVEERLQSPRLQQNATEALKTGSALWDPRTSPFEMKKEFFDEQLVQQMKSCAKPGVSLQGFGRCLDDQVAPSLSSLDEATAHKWLASAPEFKDWSGVREVALHPDPDLKFLQPPAGDRPEAHLWPFRFMLQIAFESQPVFLDGSDQQKQQYADTNPWEFPQLESFISASVWNGLQHDPEAMGYFLQMREFTLAQRIVRLAINGGFGQQFPVMKLVELTKATNSAAGPNSPTLKWMPHDEIMVGEIADYLNAEQEALQLSGLSKVPQLRNAESSLETCRNSLKAALAANGSAQVSQAACDFSGLSNQLDDACKSQNTQAAVADNWDERDDPVCGASRIAHRLVELSETSQLRQALGVTAARQQIVAVMRSHAPVCPAMH